MKAVILAGGRGERLRPITDTRPKPLVPVLARPVMDYCLSLLSHHGVDRAYVTTHYLADQIRHRYGERAFGIALSYSREEVPLGTAGGVKLLEKELSGEDFFFVMSGDALCDFDLARAVKFHKAKKAQVTIILSSVKTPLEYGVVLQDTMERIFAFSEKPDWSETLSDLVNTGVYLISPEVLKKIPEGECFDFAHDLFPLLLREGASLYGYKDDGYWCDIGKIPTLYRCNQDLMQGKAKTYLEPHGHLEKSSDGEGFYFVSNGAVVETGAEIRQNSVISEGVHLAEGAKVSGSVVMENAKIKKGARVDDALVCEGCRIGEDSVILPGCVLGAESVVGKGAATEKAKKYPPYSVLMKGPAFAEEGLVFTERGVLKGNSLGLDRASSEKLGMAFAKAFSSDIGVLWDENSKESAYFATAFAGGVSMAGKTALMLSSGIEEMASFAAECYRIPTVFVSADDKKGIFFSFGKEGMPLLRKEVLRLSRFAEEEKSRNEGGNLVFQGDLKARYLAALSEKMGFGFGQALGFSGNLSPLLKEAAIKAGYRAYDGMREEGFCLEIFHRELKLFWNGKRLCDTEKAKLFLLERELKNGRRNFVLPDTAPQYFSEHIVLRGGRTQTFSLSHTTREESALRQRATRDRWLYDLNFLAANLIFAIFSEEEKKVSEEFMKTPDLYITSLRYEAEEETKARLLRMASALPKDEKKVRLEPGFFGIKIISEALSFEAALDNAYEYRGKLNEIEEKLGGR